MNKKFIRIEGLAYRLEHADQPGTSINVEKTYLNDFKSCPSKYTFYFFRENSKTFLFKLPFSL